MIDNKVVVGISQGDVNGIGLEIILKTVHHANITEHYIPVIFSSQKTINFYKKQLELESFNYQVINSISQINSKKCNIFNCYDFEAVIEPGQTTDTGGKLARVSLETAVTHLKQKQIDVLVTAPICKQNIVSNEFNFSGHTDYLAHTFKEESMMLFCDEAFKIALATEHIKLQDVPNKITQEVITKKLNQLCNTLQNDFGIRKPKIAVLGLNPHAGEIDKLGNEEKIHIIPAIQNFKQNAIVLGPYAADAYFANALYRQFDATLAMYHDQGLIPFKTLSFNKGVNYSSGMSFIRTSPDHGTAFDIAGKNKADHNSFAQAVYMACDIFKTRQLNLSLKENPLKISDKSAGLKGE